MASLPLGNAVGHWGEEFSQYTWVLRHIQQVKDLIWAVSSSHGNFPSFLPIWIWRTGGSHSKTMLTVVCEAAVRGEQMKTEHLLVARGWSPSHRISRRSPASFFFLFKRVFILFSFKFSLDYSIHMLKIPWTVSKNFIPEFESKRRTQKAEAIMKNQIIQFHL